VVGVNPQEEIEVFEEEDLEEDELDPSLEE